MEYVLNSAQMKQVDEHSIHHIGIPSMVLMERAALAVADVFFGYEKRQCAGSERFWQQWRRWFWLLQGFFISVDLMLKFCLFPDKEGTKEYAIQKSIIENMGMSLVNKSPMQHMIIL